MFGCQFDICSDTPLPCLPRIHAPEAPLRGFCQTTAQVTAAGFALAFAVALPFPEQSEMSNKKDTTPVANNFSLLSSHENECK